MFLRVAKWCAKIATWTKTTTRVAEVVTCGILTACGVPLYVQYPIAWTAGAVVNRAISYI